MIKKINLKENKLYWTIIIIAVTLGTYIRLKGLGTWTLALDEYYIIKSSENILKFGLPQFETGGYYTRGILIQYLIAPLLSLGAKAEFVGRIFPLVSNLLAIPALYLISKKIGNKLIATIVVVIFSFSIWEIEFARFARMYAPFQTIFLWYIYFALIDFQNKNFSNYKWMLLLSALSIFVYEGSVFLAVFNFIPFILNRKIKYGYLFGAVVTFIGSVIINTVGFRYLNSKPIFPPELAEFIISLGPNSPVKIPKIILPFAFENFFPIILTLLLIAINIYLISKIIKLLGKKDFWSISSIILLGILAFLNQFGLFILIFFLVVFWQLLNISFSNKKILITLATVFTLNLLYWFGFGLLSDSWYILFSDFSSYSLWGVSKRLLVGFFSFPDNYFSLLNYVRTIPILTGFSAVSLIILFFFLLNGEENRNIKFLVGTLIFMALLATIPTLLYQETRYTFFIVPLCMILTVYSVYLLINKFLKHHQYANITFSLIILFVFVFSRDFNTYHLVNIDKEDVNYRMIYKNKYFKKHLYRRWDIKTPTDFVKAHLKEGDLIMINENSHDYYLPKVDYFSFDYRHRAFVAISVEYGEKERWSNASLIYTNKDLINLIDNRKSTIWFTVYPENYLFEIDFYKKYKKYLVYQGIDGMIKVFKFPIKDALP